MARSYMVLTWTGDPRRFDSLAVAVRFALRNGDGIVQFPDGQQVHIERYGNIVDVEHAVHPYASRDEGPGLSKVAQLVRRFSPSGTEVKVSDELVRLSEDA